MTLGTIARLSTTVYDETGRQAEQSRVYFAIPSSLPGTEGTHYDATRFAYADSGRRWRTNSPDGTISRTKFDSIGRMSSTWVGTNDNDGQFPGGELTAVPSSSPGGRSCTCTRAVIALIVRLMPRTAHPLVSTSRYFW